MKLLKIRIKSCEIDTYWYSRKINKCFYAILGTNCHKMPAYTIMALNAYNDAFKDTLERVSLCDADIIDELTIDIIKSS